MADGDRAIGVFRSRVAPSGIVLFQPCAQGEARWQTTDEDGISRIGMSMKRGLAGIVHSAIRFHS